MIGINAHKVIDTGRMTWRKSWKKYWVLYLLLIPGVIYFILMKYVPMAGVLIAFEDYKPLSGWDGIFTSKWVGFKWFARFFSSAYSGRIISNTLIISFYKLLWGFPAPILLAVLLNELPFERFKRSIQTVSYLPHFLSMVIVCSLVRSLTSIDGGLINSIIAALGGEPIYFLGSAKYFRSALVISSVWRSIGWNSIVYLAAMTSIDPQQYEAATMDGANWLQRIMHVTIPAVMPIISLMLILRVGELLDAGFEQVYLLYSPVVFDVGDIIDTFVYRDGLENLNYSYATAVSVFKSIVALVLVLGTNFITKKMGQEGIW